MWTSAILNRLFRVSDSRRRNVTRLQISELESREVPAIVTWTGAVDGIWTRGANWVGNTPPVAGDDLVFPGTATNFTTQNDFAAGTSFASISINAPSYDILGNAVSLTGSLTVDYNAGVSTIELDADLGVGLAVSNGASLDVIGALTGAGGVSLSGGGTLTLEGTNANTYAGNTAVNSGTLLLDKSAGNAIGGNLTIASGATTRLLASDQVPDSGAVIAQSAATFDLNNFNEVVGSLNLTGATVSTGSGTLTLNGNVTTNSNSNTSVISGNLDLGGATRTFTVANNAQLDPDLRITANISGSGAGLIKAGANSQLYLSGNSTYDGTTTITAGAIEVASNNALGSTAGGTVVNSGFSIAFLGNVTVPEPFTISGVGFGGLGSLFNGNGNNTLSGPITLASSTTIGSLSGNLTFSGVISDGASSFAITKVQSGTVSLSMANTYDGGTTISGGVIGISNGSALGTGSVSISNGAELDLSNDITFSRNLSFRGTGVGGNGALRSLSGNNTYSGTASILANNTRINVDAGQLTLSGDLTDNSNNFLADKTGSGTLLITGSTSATGTLQSSAGDVQITGNYIGTVTLNNGNISGTGTVGSITQVGGAVSTVNPGTGASSTGTLTTQGGYALNSAATTHIDIGGTTAGTTYDQIVNSTSGNVDISNSNLDVAQVNGFVPAIGDTFTIIDNQNGGAVIGTFNNLAEGATFASGIVTYQVSYVGGNGNDITLTVVGVVYTWTGLGGDSNWSTAANWDSNQSPTGGEELVFPAGAARLSNSNDLSGKTFRSINIAGGGYDINGNAVTLTNGLSATFSGNTSEYHPDIILTTTEAVYVIDGGDLILSGAISGPGFGINKTGGGTLEYTGFNSNTYTGATTVDAGTLILNRANGLNAIAGNLIVGDGTGTDMVILGSSDQIADGATVYVANSGTLDLSGVSDTVGGLDFTGGAITTGSGTVTLASGGSITSHASSNTATLSGHLAFGGPNNFFYVDQGTTTSGIDLDVSAVISSFNNVIKAGTGTLSFSGVNDYSGGTNINSGVLAINHDTGAGTGVVNILGTGTLDISGGITVNNNLNIATSSVAIRNSSGANTLGGSESLGANSTIDVASNSAMTISGNINDSGLGYGLVKDGNGSLILTVANSYFGNTTANAGFLRATSSDAFGDPVVSANVAVQSGASLELVGGISLPATKTITISGVPVQDASKIMSIVGDNTIQGDIAITGGNNVAFDVAGGTSLTVTGSISGSRDFDKNNTGTLILTGTNANTGNVNVGDGTLIVNGSLATSNLVFVDGVVRGSGFLPSVTISAIGTLNPGQGTGILNSGNANFTSGSTFAVEINGLTAGTQYDQLNVTGTVILDGVTLSLSAGFTPGIGDKFTIINNDGFDQIVGTFNGLPEGSNITIGTVTYQISYQGGLNSNDVVLTVLDVSYTWSGAADDRDWTNAGNWIGNVVPTAGSRLIFPANPVRTESTNNFATGTSFYSVTIEGSGYDIYGNGITLQNGLKTTFIAGGSSFGLDTLLTADETVDIAVGGTLDIPTSISGNGFGITKLGGGTLSYSGPSSNSYTGSTTVNAGSLVLDKSNGTAIAGTLIIGDGIGSDSVRLTSPNQIADGSIVSVTPSGALDFNGRSDTIGSLTFTGGSVTTGVGTLTIASGGSITSNAAASTASLSGLLRFGGPNNLIDVAQGTSPSGVDLDVSAVISSFNNIIKVGTGKLAFSASNTYGGGTNINSGVLAINHDTGAGTGVVNILGSGTLELSGGITATNNILAVSNTTAIRNTSGNNALAGTVNLLNQTTIDTTGNSSLAVTGSINGPGALNKSGTGTLVLVNQNNYTGGTTASAGFIRAANDNAFGASAITTTVDIQSGASLELSGGVTIPATKGITLSGIGGNSGISPKISNLDGSNAVLGTVMMQSDTAVSVLPGSSLLITGNIGQSGGFKSLTKLGSGELTLDVTGGYTGVTLLNEGTLLVNGNFSASAGVSVLSGTTFGGTGTIGMAVVMNGGTVNPGVTTGILNTSDFNTTSGSVVSFEINGPTVGAGYDQLNVTGGVYLYDATLSLSFGYSPLANTTFTLINNDSNDPVGGTFNGLPEGSLIVVGNNTFRMSYVGGTGNDVTLTTLATSSTGITVNDSNPGFGKPVTLTATVTPSGGTPTGTVDFYEGSTLVGSGTLNGAGQASLTLSTLARGPHAIYANYTSQGNTLGSFSTEINVTVGAAETSISVTTTNPNVTTSTYGDAVTFTALVSSVYPLAGIPTGTVIFRDGLTIISTVNVNSLGIAALTTSALNASVAPHAITAEFVPVDSNFVASSDVTPFFQTVNQATLTVTVNNVIREFGFVNPPLTATFTGFKNGENLATSNVTGSPVLSTTATQSSPVIIGGYPITASLGTLTAENYVFSFVAGQLTITPAVNVRPVIDTTPAVIVEILPAKPAVINGAPVSRFTLNITDPDFGSVKGIAITSAPSSSLTGRWEFSTNSGVDWRPVTGVSTTNALLLADVPTNRLRFVPAASFQGFATLSYTAWDTTTGLPTTGTNPSYGDTLVGTAYSIATEKATVAVGKTTPMITLNGDTLLTSILKDAKNPSGDRVNTLLGVLSTDTDKKDRLGLAVTAVDNTHGTWQYQVPSTNAVGRQAHFYGVTVPTIAPVAGRWIDIVNVSDSSALLLGPGVKVRFLPAAGFFGEASLSYHVWDSSVGQGGERATVTGSAFSAASQSAIVRVLTKPVLDISLSRTLETSSSTVTVGNLLADAVSEVTRDAILGIAVTAATGTGTWTYQIGSGPMVTMKPTVSTAILLPADAVIKFTPLNGMTGLATLNYRAWNSTTQPAVAGSRSVVTGVAFSQEMETLSLFVPPQGGNIAPVVGKTTIHLGSITEDTKVNVGVTAGTISLKAMITDANQKNIILIAADNTHGVWQYSMDGKTWQSVGVLTPNHALALADNARVRFVPVDNFNGTATLQLKAWDGTVGSSGDYLDTTVGSAFGTSVVTGTVVVTAVNDAPVLDASGVVFLPSIPKGGTSVNTTVTSLLSGASDVETPHNNLGIRVNSVAGPGRWQYSVNGITFSNLPVGVSFLSASTVLRFVGTANQSGLATLTYQAWDGSSRTASAWSTTQETLTIAVGNVAPTLTGPGTFTTIKEDQAINPGDTVAKILGLTIQDTLGSKHGIAVIGFTTSSIGIWQRSIDSGKNWLPITGVSDTTALLLADDDKIRFVPAKDQFSTINTEPTITYKAWDQTVGDSGETVNTLDAGLNSFSAAVTAKITVTSVYDAPTLDSGRLQTLDEAVSETVGDLLSGVVSSPESQVFGIAVTAISGNGIWEYSENNFATPGIAISNVSPTRALLLPTTVSLRFVPAFGFQGVATLSYKAVDMTNGQQIGTADSTSSANASFFSTAVETLNVNVGNHFPTLNTL